MKVDLGLLLVEIVLVAAAFGLALFLPAGTFHWVAAWVFLAMFFSFSLALFAWLLKHNPGLLRERMKIAAPDQRGWDRILFPMINLLLFGWLAFMALDAVRFHWSRVPFGGQMAGTVLVLVSFALLFLTFRENSYLSPVVRIQADRGHAVITTGPYRYIRHPMYCAILILVIGTSLLLGSWFGLLVGAIPLVLLARRAVLEERTLRLHLAGYAEYMALVKFRVIPGVW